MTDNESEQLRQALGQFATGVTIVTTSGSDNEPVGITANSFSSVSLEPPLVLWALSVAALSRPAFESAVYFCVHVLAASQEELSIRFGSRRKNKFAGLNWAPGPGSVPLLEEYVARFQCRMTSQYPVGDHIVFVGEVLRFDRTDKRPLVFHGGGYALAERRRMARMTRRLGENRPFPDDRRKQK